MADETGQSERENHPLIAIKPANKSDLPSIEKILRETIQNPYDSGNVDEIEVQRELKRISEAFKFPNEGETIIAKDLDEESLGFAFFGSPDPRILGFTHSEAATTMELRLLYLHSAKRNRGVGSRLLDEVEEKAKEMDMLKIELTSGPRYLLIGSGKFYLKRGYRKVGRIKNYFDGKYPADVFQKDLPKQIPPGI